LIRPSFFSFVWGGGVCGCFDVDIIIHTRPATTDTHFPVVARGCSCPLPWIPPALPPHAIVLATDRAPRGQHVLVHAHLIVQAQALVRVWVPGVHTRQLRLGADADPPIALSAPRGVCRARGHILLELPKAHGEWWWERDGVADIHAQRGAGMGAGAGAHTGICECEGGD
jgi:hypothetical protein